MWVIDFLIGDSFIRFLLVLAMLHGSATVFVLYFVSLEKRKVRRELSENVVCLESARRKRLRRNDHTLLGRSRPGRRKTILFNPL